MTTPTPLDALLSECDVMANVMRSYNEPDSAHSVDKLIAIVREMRKGLEIYASAFCIQIIPKAPIKCQGAVYHDDGIEARETLQKCQQLAEQRG